MSDTNTLEPATPVAVFDTPATGKLRQEFQAWLDLCKDRDMFYKVEVRDRLVDMLIALRADLEAGVAIEAELATLAADVSADTA